MMRAVMCQRNRCPNILPIITASWIVKWIILLIYGSIGCNACIRSRPIMLKFSPLILWSMHYSKKSPTLSSILCANHFKYTIDCSISLFRHRHTWHYSTETPFLGGCSIRVFQSFAVTCKFKWSIRISFSMKFKMLPSSYAGIMPNA